MASIKLEHGSARSNQRPCVVNSTQKMLKRLYLLESPLTKLNYRMIGFSKFDGMRTLLEKPCLNW